MLQEFADLPGAQGLNHDNYAVVNVAPSVVPTYLPSFRIYAYNTTGSLYTAGQLGNATGQPGGSSASLKSRVGALCTEKAYENTWRCNLEQPWHSNAESPSRTNRLWTPLGYAQVCVSVEAHLCGVGAGTARIWLIYSILPQYTLRGMDDADERHPPKFKLEYLTFPVAALHPPEAEGAADATDTAEPASDSADASEGKGKEKKGAKFWHPIPRRHLPRLLRNSTIGKSKKFAPYGLEDLTIPSWTALGQRLGRTKAKQLRQRFRRFMYMGADEAT